MTGPDFADERQLPPGQRLVAELKVCLLYTSRCV